MKQETTPRLELKTVQTKFPKKRITSCTIAADFIRQFYNDDIEIFESFFILLLNQANDTIGYAKISQGGVSGTVVDAKIVAKYAVDSMATSVILAHNHPSGNLKPSDRDKQLTKKIKNGLELLDINVTDHIILSSDDFLSFANDGLI